MAWCYDTDTRDSYIATPPCYHYLAEVGLCLIQSLYIIQLSLWDSDCTWSLSYTCQNSVGFCRDNRKKEHRLKSTRSVGLLRPWRWLHVIFLNLPIYLRSIALLKGNRSINTLQLWGHRENRNRLIMEKKDSNTIYVQKTLKDHFTRGYLFSVNWCTSCTVCWYVQQTDRKSTRLNSSHRR